MAQQYAIQGADELVFLDISATLESRGTTRDMVRKVAQKLKKIYFNFYMLKNFLYATWLFPYNIRNKLFKNLIIKRTTREIQEHGMCTIGKTNRRS